MTRVQEVSQAKLYFPTKVPNQDKSVSVYFATIITGVTTVSIGVPTVYRHQVKKGEVERQMP